MSLSELMRQKRAKEEAERKRKEEERKRKKEEKKLKIDIATLNKGVELESPIPTKEEIKIIPPPTKEEVKILLPRISANKVIKLLKSIKVVDYPAQTNTIRQLKKYGKKTPIMELVNFINEHWNEVIE